MTDADKAMSVQRMTDASMKALDMPGGDAVLDDMLSGKLTIDEGIAKLLVMSGEYEYKETTT